MIRASDVTVVIPNYNGAALLPATLDAVAVQAFGQLDVLVVDNGSTDASLSLLAERDVRVLALPRNTGFAGGANAGVRATDRPYVVVLNSDARPESGWLEALLAVVSSSPPDVWAWGSVLVDDTGVIESAGDGWRHGTTAYKLLQGAPVSALPEQAYEVFAAPGAAPLFRRDVFLALSGYDESFFLYYEDIDLAWRARLQGHRALLVPTARVRHLGAASGRPFRTWFHISRNALWCGVRNPPELHPRLLLAATRREWATAGRRGVRLPYAVGRAAGVAGLPRQLAVRRRLQRTRTVDPRALQAFLDRQEDLVAEVAR